MSSISSSVSTSGCSAAWQRAYSGSWRVLLLSWRSVGETPISPRNSNSIAAMSRTVAGLAILSRMECPRRDPLAIHYSRHYTPVLRSDGRRTAEGLEAAHQQIGNCGFSEAHPPDGRSSGPMGGTDGLLVRPACQGEQWHDRHQLSSLGRRKRETDTIHRLGGLFGPDPARRNGRCVDAEVGCRGFKCLRSGHAESFGCG